MVTSCTASGYGCCGRRASGGGGSGGAPGATASARGRLQGVYRKWLESFAPYWEESLGRLKRRVEERGAGVTRKVETKAAAWHHLGQLFPDAPSGTDRPSYCMKSVAPELDRTANGCRQSSSRQGHSLRPEALLATARVYCRVTSTRDSGRMLSSKIARFVPDSDADGMTMPSTPN